ncbi:MAG: cytochrome c biogenesis protein CcsA [Candidatus Hydrogenedentes bacterium]|nr:cytochrome c biogenesis protein CcsA [Candidatus Hydrogenedentota bacterium]
MKTLAATLVTLFALGGMATALGQGAEIVTKPAAWDEETVDAFASLPVQDGGRIKPLSTYAGFTLLRLNGKREVSNLDGKRLNPTEWLLDTLYYPEAASHYKMFLVQTSEVLDAIGVSHEGRKKRDRYSMAELSPGVDKLFQLGREYSDESKYDPNKLTSTQRQIINLATNVSQFQYLSHYLDFARHEFTIPADSPLAAMLPERRYSDILDKAVALRLLTLALEKGMDAVTAQLDPAEVARLGELLPQGLAELDESTRQKNLGELRQLLHEVDVLSSRASGLSLFPPTPSMGDQEHWLAAGEMADLAFSANAPVEEQLALLRSLEETARLIDKPEAFGAQVAAFHDAVVALAQSRGEYNKIPLEVSYYRADFLYWSLILFVLAFLVAAVSWLLPYKRVAGLVYPLFLAPPTLLLIAAITYRCIIRGRPPVSTLYETILFITAVIVVVAIVMEYINRQKIALSIGAFLGMAGIFLAYRYEAKEGVDTMPSLIAVLDTNFWLATHVTTVTMGYAAGLLAAAIAHVYILGRALGFRRSDKDFYKNVTRMTYGVLCFGLVFSVVGTVLGGIWANDSWGRFWGWDPKENGALMIVLWELAILHARMGGYIRDLGLAVSSVFCGMIVAFSWWGVNLLGVGLHSYGFTSGIMQSLVVFWGLETVVMLAGLYVWFLQRRPAPVEDAVPSGGKGRTKRPLPAKASE